MLGIAQAKRAASRKKAEAADEDDTDMPAEIDDRFEENKLEVEVGDMRGGGGMEHINVLISVLTWSDSNLTHGLHIRMSIAGGGWHQVHAIQPSGGEGDRAL